MITSQVSIMAFYAARVIFGVLVLLSIFSIAFFIERILFYRKNFLKTDSLLPELENAESLNDVRQILSDFKSSETSILLKGLAKGPLTANGFRKKVSAYFQPEKQAWERHTNFLGSVGSNAPFIGLLGTVLGILKSFSDLSTATAKGPQVVMAGISEALVLTAVGLLVAIPAVVFFNILKSSVKKSTVRVESISDMILSKSFFTEE